QSTLFNRRAGGLLIAGALILLGTLVIVAHFPAPSPPIPEPSPVKDIPPNALSRLDNQPRTPVRPFHASDLPPYQSDFYRTIINNNLFRPLGWTPPRRKEPYRLLGTMVPKDGKTPLQAIIQVSTAGNQTHIVSIGDTFDADTKIVDIQPKQVTLDRAGQQTTLKLNTSPWISTAKGRFSR
ncbi:MAG: hypothetical protein OXH00_03190, partial [Candidatus Poribacteria bacterium]|nr:hypothetical protein [Candidatus Poribacteria bacterium]